MNNIDLISHYSDGTERILPRLETEFEGVDYKCGVIGKKIWMFENLKVTRFKNGDNIMFADTQDNWKRASDSKTPAWCYSEAHIKGTLPGDKLYNWYVLKDNRGLAPREWHIPSIAEWNDLNKLEKMDSHFGGAIILKSKTGWNNKNLLFSGNGSNETGFNGYPCGYISETGSLPKTYGKSNYGDIGCWWTSTQVVIPDERTSISCKKYSEEVLNFIIREDLNNQDGLWKRNIPFIPPQFKGVKINSSFSYNLDFESNFLCTTPKNKGYGLSVRCVYDHDFYE